MRIRMLCLFSLSWTAILAVAVPGGFTTAHQQLKHDHLRASLQQVRSIVRPSLRSHRRLAQDAKDDATTKNENNDDDRSQKRKNNAKENDKAKQESEMSTSRFVTVSFSLLAIQRNTTTQRLRQVRPPVVECAMTNMLCLETDLVLTSSDDSSSAEDPCKTIRKRSNKPPSLPGTNINATMHAQPYIDRAFVTHQEGLEYLEWTLSYQAGFDKDEAQQDDIDQDAAQLKALVQMATEASIEDGTMDNLLQRCYKDSRGEDEAEKMKLKIYSSIVGDELETFSFHVDSAAQNKPAWQDWFAELNLPAAIGFAVAAAALLVLAFLLSAVFCRRYADKKSQDKSSQAWNLHGLSKPIPLTRAPTITTVKQPDSSDDGDSGDSVDRHIGGLDLVHEEDDFSESQAADSQAARVMEMLEHGSDLSMTGDSSYDGEYSLCDERTYEQGLASPPAAYSFSLGLMQSESEDDDELYFKDEDEAIFAQTSNSDGQTTHVTPDTQGPSPMSIAAIHANERFSDISLVLEGALSVEDDEASCDDTVTEASQGYASDGDAGLVPPIHEEDESSAATSPMLNRSCSFKRIESRSDAMSDGLGDIALVRSKSMHSTAIFRRSVDYESIPSLHVKDLDSGRVLPLESAASF